MNTSSASRPVRVRFAPSPTGHLHIGSVRTALFNYLFARHHGGTYLIRVEDTDKERSTDKNLQSQLESLRWFGLEADEAPTIQSTRVGRHLEMIDQLIAEDKAYERDGAIWFRVPRERVPRDGGDEDERSFIDLIRGKISIPLNTVDDFVIRRSDGSPIYNFCVVIDDHDMEISHVIRGEDHISNTVKQLLLYEAFGWQAPQFAHLPLIVGANNAPLSKRDGVTDVTLYKQHGFLPDALLNYLVRLGWAHGDQEIFSRDEMIRLFTLGGVGKKAAVFDTTKLRWLNQQYVSRLSVEEVSVLWHELGVGAVSEHSMCGWPRELAAPLLELYKPRSETIVELAESLTALANEPTYDELPEAPWLTPQTPFILDAFVQRAQKGEAWDKESLLTLGRQIAKEYDGGLAIIGQPLRLALTGGINSPSIFEVVALLGKDLFMTRVQRFVQRLRQDA
ncbi:MAG: glutamate--tRNA ligase family protein [Candidatus Dependentiae bacterium]|jgi:glutamyl-tRNA synthetase